MYQFPAEKGRREDWRYFNQAVETRADYLRRMVIPPPSPPPAAPPPPSPPAVDWLRRGLGVASVIVALGVATALVIWASEPRSERTQVLAAPPAVMPEVQPPPANPVAPGVKVTVDFTKFTTVTLDNGKAVTTGWRYNSSNDDQPTAQYCYVSISGVGLVSLRVDLGNTAIGVFPYDGNNMAPLTRAEFDAAAGSCRWAPGTVLPSPQPELQPQPPSRPQPLPLSLRKT